MKLSRKKVFVGLALSIYNPHLTAATITVNSGSTLLISGGKLNLDCDDIEVIINDGGSMTVSGGVVTDLNIRIKNGGNYSKSGGNVTECDGFFIIMTPNGAAVVNL